MERVWNGVAVVARVAVWLGGAMLFAAAGIVTAEVLLRKGLGALVGSGFVFSGSDEISSYLFAVGTSWSLAYALISRGHVRIDALYSRFNLRTRAAFDLIALIVLAIFVAALLERAWNVAYTSFTEDIHSNTQLRLPLAAAQLPWFGGIALFAVVLVLAILRTTAALFRGDYGEVAALAGASSQDEEVDSELESLGLSRDRSGRGD